MLLNIIGHKLINSTGLGQKASVSVGKKVMAIRG